MKNFNLAIRSLFKKNRGNGIKVLSLSVGMAMGLVLVAKIYFEKSFDTFYPDTNRIYAIKSDFIRDGELKEWFYVSGAIAPGMKAEVPGVEESTRHTGFIGEQLFSTEDESEYRLNPFMVDEHFFDIFQRDILDGDPKEILTRPMYAMISRSLADRMGGRDIVGKTIWPKSYPNLKITIGGIFEDFPENSTIQHECVISLCSIGQVSYDGRDNWIGNDRYQGFVKLREGVDPDDLALPIRSMQEKHQPLDEFIKDGSDLRYILQPLLSVHDDVSKNQLILLSLLSFALLFTAVMNYVLIVISSLVGRGKEVAVHKCYGASEKNINAMMMSEALVHVVASSILAAIFVSIFRPTVEELLGASLTALFTWQSLIPILIVFAIIILITGLVPGYLFARIPVASAFRNFKENRRVWKLALLFVQFTAASFLIALLLVIGKQYNFMVNDHTGYSYDRLLYCGLNGVDSTSRQKVLDEISALPEVEKVSTSYTLPFYSHSGNNVVLDDKELFNIADLYNVGNGYFDLMEIPIVMGRSFTEDTRKSDEVMVSRKFVDKMAKYADWSDGPIGKRVEITEHNWDNQNGTKLSHVIVGVYDDIRLETIASEDDRPSVMFHSNSPSFTLLVKMRTLTADGIANVSNKISEILPDKDTQVKAYQFEMVNMYRDSRLFRDSVMIGGIITLLISLIGLLGYTRDEINRRRSELAIRKVNGATLTDIFILFVYDILCIATPSVSIGAVIAFFVSEKWQEQFSDKIPLSWYLFVIPAIIVLVVLVTTVCANCYRMANENPQKYLKGD